MKQKSDIITEIINHNSQREDHNLSPYACKSSAGLRKFPEREKVPDHLNFRPAFFHDTDKIIHSLAYTRYIDKTQVFYLFKNDHITHRALHVQFVAKIGRVIGRALRLNEDLIEAIALGHDLGHPPYGHDGEKILNRICQENRLGSFCHNAQSVRSLMQIEQHGEGRNMSLQVLDGILAHNGEMLSHHYEPAYHKTWDQFEEEYRKCFADLEFNNRIVPMTLEGCVARISDIIAYIGRDIEDAIMLKLIKRKDIPASITHQLGGATNDKIINTLVTDVIFNSYEQPYLAFSEDIFQALRELKAFNFTAIYSNDKIKTQGYKIDYMFNQLFNLYNRSMKNNDEQSAIVKHLKDMNETYQKKTPAERKIIDFIAGMTDNFFNDQYRTLFVPQSYGYSL
jgi:dGTPase